MIRISLQTLFTKDILINTNHNFFRYVRSIARREVAPKFVAGNVKTITEFDDDTPYIGSYKDFVKSVEESKLGDQLEIEKHFLSEDYHGEAIERCEGLHQMHLGEEKSQRSKVKKHIIHRKYFKLDKETNLLTHAAKEQIRSLHESNPMEWNCKVLSECFPISEAGVKKLLKCNFVQTCPEKIKAHDEAVAEKWKILKSGKPTDLIFPITQKLYKEGKLVDDYFSGNPKLPTILPSKKVIKIEEKKEAGEFSSIVQTYVDHEKQKVLTNAKENVGENRVSLRDGRNLNSFKKTDNINFRRFKYAREEFDDNNADPEVYSYRRRRNVDDSEIPFSQFKAILKEETSLKLKSKKKNEYDEFVMQQTSTDENISSKNPYDSQNCFFKINKYDKDKNISVMYENNKNVKSVYKYDEKFGYQYPIGKNIRGKINLSNKLQTKGKLYKAGQCVYDDDGELLYKVPT